jgi:hypothetical protein
MGSPDLGDAFILTFAGSAATALYGSEGYGNRSWNQPMLRDDKWVI